METIKSNILYSKDTIYLIGKSFLIKSFHYEIIYGKNNEEILKSANNLSMDPIKDMRNQVIIRMGGRAAQELSGLELSTERFYTDLELAMPHIKNIAVIKGKDFPDITFNEYKKLPEEYLERYILIAKKIIDGIAKANDITVDTLIKNVIKESIIAKNNKLN